MHCDEQHLFRSATGLAAFSFCITLLVNGAVARNLQLASIIPYRVRVAPALVNTGAALDIAIEDVKHRYNGTMNFSLALLFDAQELSCADLADTLVDRVSHFYYENRRDDTCMAIIATSTWPLEQASVW